MRNKNELKILFATDFSLSSRIALKTLKLIQEKYTTNSSMIHVIDSFWKDWLASGLYQKEAKQRLISWKEEYADYLEINNLYVKTGNSADTILGASHKMKANLILMGGKVTEESQRYKTSASIESVVRFATASVWVCQSEKISKILCGIDGSPSSGKALQFAIDLARRYSAKLCIIHALPTYFPVFGTTKIASQKDEEKFKIENSNKIKKFIESFDIQETEYEISVQWGTAANIILDSAEDFDYNLIVIGAKGHSKLHYMMLGSTAEKILRYTPCSLLVVK